jgi:hypothetical protein
MTARDGEPQPASLAALVDAVGAPFRTAAWRGSSARSAAPACTPPFVRASPAKTTLFQPAGSFPLSVVIPAKLAPTPGPGAADPVEPRERPLGRPGFLPDSIRDRAGMTGMGRGNDGNGSGGHAVHGGGEVATLNRNHVHNLPTVIPPMELVRAFDSMVMPLLKRRRSAELESVSLAALRDTLLPKLISGELRVPDAARIVTAA